MMGSDTKAHLPLQGTGSNKASIAVKRIAWLVAMSTVRTSKDIYRLMECVQCDHGVSGSNFVRLSHPSQRPSIMPDPAVASHSHIISMRSFFLEGFGVKRKYESSVARQ